MKKSEIIIQVKKKIKILDGLKRKAEKDLKWVNKLPNDPSVGVDVLHDGILNENPHLKTDLSGGHNHTIAYCEGALWELKEQLYFLTVSKKQYKKDCAKNKEIKKENKKEFNRVKKQLFKK